MEYVYQGCGKQTHATITCSECGEPLRPQEVITRVGPALEDAVAQMENEGIRDPDIQSLLSHST